MKAGGVPLRHGRLRTWSGIAAHFAVLFFAFPFLHGFLHIYWVFYFSAYSPGVISAVLLLMPACALLAVRGVRDRLVPRWFIPLACLLNLPPAVAAIRLGRHAP